MRSRTLTDARLALGVERRIEAALDVGTSLDAKLVLLTLHAKLIQPSVVDHFGSKLFPIEIAQRAA
jgi:hypothetical protein